MIRSSPRLAKCRFIVVATVLAYVASLAGTLPVSNAAPPPNDDIATATRITHLKFETRIDTRQATEAADDPKCYLRNTHTVWYTFTPPRDMRLEMLTSPGHQGNQPITASAYVGSPGSLEQTACSSSSPADGLGARAGILAHGGETLFLMVGIAGRTDGETVAFTLRRGRLPSNDDFDHATVVDSLPFSQPGDGFWATPAADDPETPAGCPDVPAKSVWYRYTASENTRLFFGIAPLGTVLGFTGARGSLSPIGCSSEVGAGVFVNVAAGETVHFLVSWGFHESGFAVADPKRLPRARNDRLRSATQVGRLPLDQSTDTTSATARPADPDCFGAVSTVWYSFTPRIDMRIEATTSGSRYDTVLAAFESATGGLTKIDCLNDNLQPGAALPFGTDSGFATERLRFRALAGHTYQFMVGALSQPLILQFELREFVPVHVSPQGTVSADGIATIHGTITCTHELEGQGFGLASQVLPSGRVLQGYLDKSSGGGCRSGTRRFSIATEAVSGEFRSGALHVELGWEFTRPDRFGRYTQTRVSTDVALN